MKNGKAIQKIFHCVFPVDKLPSITFKSVVLIVNLVKAKIPVRNGYAYIIIIKIHASILIIMGEILQKYY